MHRQVVISSNVASIGYDPMNHILEVEFKTDGSIYNYYDVPEDVHIRIMASPSIGKAIFALRNDKYKFKKVN